MRPRAEPILLGFGLCLLAACGPDPVPKPKGYFRIDLPTKAYTVWTPECPFTAEIPVYAKVLPGNRPDQNCWYNLTFPDQRAIVHMTYREVHGDLAQLIDDAHSYKSKHEAKAVKISTERVLRDSARVFGNVFDVEGDVASPLVFYMTDSTTNFLYGALYFSAEPNADSLAPVTTRLREDLRHLVGTLRWTEGAVKH